ncbi:hypothetical protein Pmani_037421 [Petrolisthes manimaculis]|uniref:CCHC-type domain-containing protein n=1 Tax=Petrolisthes manimaculis TaxID=1843537 RepID=A0AAE1NHB9_9EUCA|nr:hypothetical protein Pmani_037421 [Petrolisthes manimaculis]
MPKPKKTEQEVVPHSPTTLPGTPRVQAQAVGESHDVILQMLQLFKDECEQKRQEDIRRREAEEQRLNQLVATLGGQTMQQGTSSPVGPIPVSPSTQVVSTPVPKATVVSPPALSQDVTLQAFKEWRQQWEDYAVMVDLHKQPQPKQLIQLRSCLSPEMRRTLEVSLGVLPGSSLTLREVLECLQDYVKGQRNEALRRLSFSQCRQAEGEKFNDFYVRLKQAADEIDLCKADDLGCVETQMKHAVLIGIRDEETKQRLLELPTDTTLDRVLTLCKSREAAENTSHELRPQSVLQPTTCAVSMYKKRKKQAWKPSGSKGSVDYNSGSTQPRVTCDRCGGRPHPKDRCPAVGERCRSCGKVGHYAKRCRSKTVKGVKDPPGLRDRSGNVLCVVSNPRDTGSPCSAIYTAHTRAVGATATSLVCPTSPSINLHVQAGDKSGCVECMPDTGADTTVMGSELLDTLGLTSADLRPSPELGLSNPDGSPMACPILGSLYATMTYGEISIQGWIIVVGGLSRQLLSYHHTKQLRIVPQDYPRQMKRQEDRQQHLDGSVRQIAAPYHPTRKPRLPPVTASPNEAPEWRKGKLLAVPDALSRAPVDTPSPEDVALSEKACIHVRNVVSHRAASLDTATPSGGDMVIDGMRVAAQEDTVYTQLLEYVTKGFPTTCDRLDPVFKPFWKEPRLEAAKDSYDAHARPLPPLDLGTTVRVQHPVTKRWDTVGTVMGIGRSRDYHVRTPSGRVLWRNRRFLRAIPSQAVVATDVRCDLPDTTPTQECQAPDPPKPRRRCRGRWRGPLRRSVRVAERS